MLLFTIIAWATLVFSGLGVILFITRPLMRNRKDETLQLRMIALIYAVLIVAMAGHILRFW